MEKKSLAEKLNKKYHKALEITDLKDLLYKLLLDIQEEPLLN